MNLTPRFNASRLFCLAMVAATLAADQAPAADAETREAQKRKFISVLQSDAPPQDKAIACKKLAVCGDQDAVPALAPYLADHDLASWARIALEAIPGPAADAALREALGRVQGALLIGVCNSIGYRRDAQAVDALVGRLKDADAEAASAAAVALGRIGGERAAQALAGALTSSPAGVRSAVAEGCILCAERFHAEGKSTASVQLYDTVRQANVPPPRRLEATRGAILARQSAGLPLLLEQLRSAEQTFFNIGLRTARELPGREVTEALAAELNRARADRQVWLLLALSDRQDAAVLPAVIAAAKTGANPVRIAAVRVLERLGDVSSVPVLLEAATAEDTELAQTARGTLARLHGEEVDADLLRRLAPVAGKQRQILIELAGLRRLDGALPAIVRSAEDPDAGVRAAAVQAVGVLGRPAHAAEVVRLLQQTPSPAARADLEKALLAICGRGGAACVPYLGPLARSADTALRLIALQALASIGGPAALDTVKAAVNDPAETVQDEAVRTLSTWPNNWPEDTGVAEALLALAKSGTKPSHQVLGLRGYLQSVQGDKKLPDKEKVARVTELLPLLQRPEEKRLAIAVIGATSQAAVLPWLTSFASDPAVAEDAYAAIVGLAGKNLPDTTLEQRQKALRMVQENSKNDALRRRAEEALKGIQ